MRINRIPQLIGLNLLALAFALVAAPARAEGTVRVGRLRIPQDFKYSGEVHGKGAYELRIEPGSEGPYLVLADASGKELLRELAIVQDVKGKVAKPTVAVHLLTRDEHMVRLLVREDGKRYLAYFESTS